MQASWLWGFDQFINDITTPRGESMKDTPRTTMFNTFAVEGMTLRDYFAAKAMAAIIIASDKHSNDVNEIHEWLGSYAYIAADLMIKEREKCE